MVLCSSHSVAPGVLGRAINIDLPKVQPKFQLDLLKTNQELKDQFSVDVKNRFQALESITEADELFEKMRDSINEVMELSVPVRV